MKPLTMPIKRSCIVLIAFLGACGCSAPTAPGNKALPFGDYASVSQTKGCK